MFFFLIGISEKPVVEVLDIGFFLLSSNLETWLYFLLQMLDITTKPIQNF